MTHLPLEETLVVLLLEPLFVLLQMEQNLSWSLFKRIERPEKIQRKNIFNENNVFSTVKKQTLVLTTVIPASPVQ